VVVGADPERARYWVIDPETKAISPAPNREDSPLEVDVIPWAENVNENRTVAWRVFGEEADGPVVSTIFMGLNHRIFGLGPPLVFETMIFWSGSRLDHYQERYSTWDEAVTGHKRAVARVKRALRRRKKPESSSVDGT
jgi:hypothetical protein